jgi:hypothetical protein
MIFGFNTDIKQGATVYHVQSEARESELLLQTQVFVRGRCIGKRATPYGDKLAGALLTSKDTACATSTASCSTPSVTAPRRHSGQARDSETLARSKLDVQWLRHWHADRNLTMRLRVTESGSGVPGARLTVRFARPTLHLSCPGGH